MKQALLLCLLLWLGISSDLFSQEMSFSDQLVDGTPKTIIIGFDTGKQ